MINIPCLFVFVNTRECEAPWGGGLVRSVKRGEHVFRKSNGKTEKENWGMEKKGRVLDMEK